jgi:iron complex outermembrane receptor protein
MLYNLTNTKYETDAWVYRYIYEGSEQSLTGYFPQATLHFLTGLRIGF